MSIDRVLTEILAGGDELSAWARARAYTLFPAPDASIVQSMRTVSQWATNSGYDPAALATFLQVADYYLVAYAHAHQHVIVTHEVFADTVKKIKIPNACLDLGIGFMNPYEMLRVEQAKFVLGT